MKTDAEYLAAAWRDVRALLGEEDPPSPASRKVPVPIGYDYIPSAMCWVNSISGHTFYAEELFASQADSARGGTP